MAAATGDGPQPLGHIAALDGVRAIAITAVMGLHAIDRLFPAGALGVDVFFALSAFLISSLIIGDPASHSGGYDFVRFYGRRAFRLLPALVLWLVAVAAPTAAITGTADTIVTSTVAALFYIANFAERIGLDVGASYAHAWSLSIEEQFYFVWPAVLIFGLLRMPPKKRRASLFLGVVGSLLMLVVGQRLIEGNYFLPSGHLVPLAIGALAADLWMFGMPERLDRALKRPIAGFFSIAVIAALVTSVDLATAAEWAMPATGVVAGVLILHVALNERSAPSRLLALAPVEWLGRRSYGLYLYHRTITGLVPALWVDVRLLYAGPLALALSLAVAELSYRFVERPARRRGNAWLDRNHRRNRLRAVAATSD